MKTSVTETTPEGEPLKMAVQVNKTTA
jgi:hypothetical protein